MFETIKKAICTLYKQSRVSSTERGVFKYLQRQSGHSAKKSGGVCTVLLQCVESPYYFALFGLITSSLKKRMPLQVEQYVYRSLNVEESASIIRYTICRLFLNPLSKFKWVRLYRIYCGRVGLNCVSFDPINDALDFFRAWKQWRRIETCDGLNTLNIDGILIGDLINDSYLRFKPSPTVKLKDRYLLVIIWHAYRLLRRSNKYFSTRCPDIFLASYSTYIQHGIPVRVALSRGIRVFSFGYLNGFVKELTCSDYLHARNTEKYAEIFLGLSDKENKRQEAEKGLLLRLSGGIDNATFYMRESAYTTTSEEVPDVRGSVVVFLHDFFDSPHVYQDMIFHDFWQWICFTIECLEKNNINFFLKPHPNQIALSNSAVSELQKKYPAMRMIPPKITNKQLVESGMVCAISVYGTVIHEMAYLGVATIACARHPHASFSMCKTAKNKNEYAEMLKNCLEIDLDSVEARKQSLAFYYMHNLYFSDGEKEIVGLLQNLRKDCAQAVPADNMTDSLDRIIKTPVFCEFISKLELVRTFNGG